MDTSQLKCVVQSDPVVRTSTLGVYAADQIPRQIQYGGFITNTDASSKPGALFSSMALDSLNFLTVMDNRPNIITIHLHRVYGTIQEFSCIIV